MIEILSNNHFEKIMDLFDSAKQSIRIVSPFLTKSMTDKLCRVVADQHISCTFITRLYIEDLVAKANSIEALSDMLSAGLDVLAVKGLHAKLYIFDDSSAVVGSANFTSSGFKSNIELSLLIQDEPELLQEIIAYFDSFSTKVASHPEAHLSNSVLEDAQKRYLAHWSEKKSSGIIRSGKMYGASLDKKSAFSSTSDLTKELDDARKDNDLIFSLFRETEKQEQIHFPQTIWMKLSGAADDRLQPDEPLPMSCVDLNGKKIYVSNYPFKVQSIKDGDEIYMAALTTDLKGRNQPVIVGRGHLRSFDDSNYILPKWVEEYPWMDRYPWYAVINDCKIVDASVNKGIPMDSVWEALGSDTYLSSFGRSEDIASVAKKHYQKAHIRLSGNAKVFIDKRLDSFFEQYGCIDYISDE